MSRTPLDGGSRRLRRARQEKLRDHELILRPRRCLRQMVTTSINTALAILSGVAVWYFVGEFAERLPVPHEVIASVIDILKTPESYADIRETVRRVLTGFIGSTILALSFGTMIGSNRWVRALLKPWVIVALSIPGPVAVITAVLIFGIGERSTMIALVFSVTPYVINIIVDGVGAIDYGVVKMSRIFRASWAQRWRDVIFPQLVPSILAAVRTSFALSWKLVVIIEALSASRGVGAQMLRSFRILNVSEMIAWALLFTIVMGVADVAVFQALERRLLRWRTRAKWS